MLPESITMLLSDHTFRIVMLGTVLIGATSGGIGCFAYLRKQSMAGDVVAHSSLVGMLAFFIASHWLFGVGQKQIWVLVPGAMVSGFLALSFSNFLVRRGRIRADSALGVMLAIFFGSGLFLLRWVQSDRSPIEGRGGLEDYIFGMATSLTRADTFAIAILSLIAFLFTCLTWKELKVYTFDPVLADCLGYRRGGLEFLMTTILVMAIVIGLQSIGVILMVAMLIAPAAAARQWTSALHTMVITGAAFGAFSAAAGTCISAVVPGLPTGPVIVLVSAMVFLVSILCSPQRGILWQKPQLAGELN